MSTSQLLVIYDDARRQGLDHGLAVRVVGRQERIFEGYVGGLVHSRARRYLAFRAGEPHERALLLSVIDYPASEEELRGLALDRIQRREGRKREHETVNSDTEG